MLTSQHLFESFPPFYMKWELEEIPEDSRKGLIVKIPKNRDSVCDITLSINSNLIFSVILNRIRMAVDQKIREEQA